MDVAIYGAQAIAFSTYKAIKEIYKEYNVCCFIVTSTDNNPTELDDIPVYSLSELLQMNFNKNNAKVIIATPESVICEIKENLEQNGFTNIECIDSEKFAFLQEQYYEKTAFCNVLSSYSYGDTKAELEIYMTKFWKDKELISKTILPQYFVPVQAGAANTDVRVCDILDNEGDNISAKNGDYSELTVLYWAWKHMMNGEKYYGLAHYRRYLMVNEEDLNRLISNDIDVVLPYPMIYEPDIEVHHKRYLSDEEWNAVLQALDELYPEYAKGCSDILKQQYFYNYNIIIAKKEVMSDYCNWLFKILFRVEKLVNSDGKRMHNRYIGYIGENLTTLYFIYNRNKLKLAHTGCKFLK